MMVILWGFGAYEMLPNSMLMSGVCIVMLFLHSYQALHNSKRANVDI